MCVAQPTTAICSYCTCVRPFGTYWLSALDVLATDAGEKEVASVSALRQMKVFMVLIREWNAGTLRSTMCASVM